MNAQEYKIKGWVVRDCYGLWLYKQKPHRVNGKHTSHWTNEFGPNSEYCLDEELFPELTWESEPIEVELTIKKI